jgi:hypothetical protein
MSRGEEMRRLAIVSSFVLAVALLGLPSGIRAQSTGVSDTLDKLRQATIAGDLDTVLGLYSPEAVVVSPFGTFSGPAAIQAFYTGFLQQNPGLSVTFVDRQVALDTTEVHHSMVSSDAIRSAGLERIVFIETIVVFQGKVISATILLDLSDPQTVQFAAAVGGGG